MADNNFFDEDEEFESFRESMRCLYDEHLKTTEGCNTYIYNSAMNGKIKKIMSLLREIVLSNSPEDTTTFTFGQSELIKTEMVITARFEYLIVDATEILPKLSELVRLCGAFDMCGYEEDDIYYMELGITVPDAYVCVEWLNKSFENNGQE